MLPPLQDFILFLNRTTKTSQGTRQQWHIEACHKRFFFSPNTILSMLQITAVIRVQDKWERWTWDKRLPLSCCLLIKGPFNPFVIIAYSAHHIHLAYLAPGALWLQNANRQYTYFAHYAVCRRAHSCTLLALSALCSLYFVDSCRSPHLSLTHFKENPHPSKSAILLGAYGW